MRGFERHASLLGAIEGARRFCRRPLLESAARPALWVGWTRRRAVRPRIGPTLLRGRAAAEVPIGPSPPPREVGGLVRG